MSNEQRTEEDNIVLRAMDETKVYLAGDDICIEQEDYHGEKYIVCFPRMYAPAIVEAIKQLMTVEENIENPK